MKALNGTNMFQTCNSIKLHSVNLYSAKALKDSNANITLSTEQKGVLRWRLKMLDIDKKKLSKIVW